eukprot:gnl/Dysnectes_brevis/1225_a1369_4446.p1 GENE.gnl/Dysnectes_brevis/1225_a1369_4446~~gnl/Dysnectes_brevis/1225_a1369_4446.p1  ORF type:complete len:405 (+),score=180.78 gnl/Dysnectes_brevis/1225_a1369_4446:102-1316(+)
MNKLSIKDIEIAGKRVLCRVDFNVPLNKQGEITNTKRIDAAIPTIKYILEKGAKSIVLMSHMGRPKGKVTPTLSLAVCVPVLEAALGAKVVMLKDCVGAEVEAATADPAPGSIFLLENLRFHTEETSKAITSEVEAFRASLAKTADVFCSDAFGTAHRAHSSMMGHGFAVRCAGLLLQKEIDYFNIALSSPQRPYLAILGGAKVKDKILLIKNLLTQVDKLIICGGMTYTFLKVLEGMQIGGSLYDSEGAKIVHEIMATAAERGVEMIFPVDFKITNTFSNDGPQKYVTKEEGIPEGWEGLDCGPKTFKIFGDAVRASKTIIWNGPAGVFEFPNFAAGSYAIADACVEATAAGSLSIIGGGDTATVAKNYGIEAQISHISTGGGASIELLQGAVLPGLATLTDK